MSEPSKIINVDINLLTPNRYQPRKVFNEESIKELAMSIKEYGIINPILVRKNNEQYEIIAGERRWRAAKSIGLSQVPVIIKELESQKMAEIALIENLQRENLTSIEEAKSLKQIMSLTNITQDTLGKMIGKSQSAIANKLRLLALPNNIQEALSNQKISERHARSLLTIEDDTLKTELLNKIINEKLTVKDLEKCIKQYNSSEKTKISISDIMASIKQNDSSQIDKMINEKEEKESDNMNNGNFFPSFNNQINPNQNLNTSLNSLNIQSVNNQMPQPVNETVMPTQGVAQPSIMQSSEPYPTTNTEVMPPLYNIAEENPIPNFTGNENISNEAVLPSPATMSQNAVDTETSLPNNQPTGDQLLNIENPNPQPDLNSLNSQESVNFSSIVQDAPLFSTGETLSPVGNINEPLPPQNMEPIPAPATYEVPVMSEPAIAPTVDNLTKTTEFLNQSNIPYKLYSNETGSCIIIEL